MNLRTLTVVQIPDTITQQLTQQDMLLLELLRENEDLKHQNELLKEQILALKQRVEMALSAIENIRAWLQSM